MYFPVVYNRTLFIYSIYNSLHLLIPNSQFIPPPPLFPLATTSPFSMSFESVSVSQINSFASYFRFHIQVIYGICFSLSDLLHLFNTQLYYKPQPPLRNMQTRSSHHGTAETNLTRNHEVVGLVPGFAQQVKDLALL